MKIKDVIITNWQPPGDKWWDNVKSKPDEPLIEATMKLTLSLREYHALLQRDERLNQPG